MYPFDDSSSLVTAAQFVGLALATRWLLKPKETPAKKLHVDYGGETPLPLPLKIITSLPDAIRFPMLLKFSKPTPPKDSIDILGEDEGVDPYKKREILEGKIWGVQYMSIVDPALAKFMEMFMEGTKGQRQMEAISRAPDHLKDILKEDFERKEKYDTLSEREKAQLGGDTVQEMFVIKLDDGGLILYNPIRMHPQMVNWIKERGEVKFIISGSSAHTNHLPGTAATFPDAQIICASVADMKCFDMRAADYLYDLRRDEEPPRNYAGRGTLEDALEALGDKVKLFHIRGDVATQALFLLVHGHLFEVDLMYVPSEEGKKEWEFETGTSIMQTNYRIFTYTMITEKAKPLGYTCPLYRCMFMDPSNPFAAKMSLNPPKKDGSSCTEMAASLGSALKQLHKPGVCERVHSCHAGSMSLGDFSRILGQTWGWLDEKKLGWH